MASDLSNVSTDIKFSKVREAAANIKRNRDKMEEHFDHFGETVRGLRDRGQFVGSAADAFDDKYQKLATTFNKYTDKVQEFFEIVGYSADQTEDTQNALENLAQSLED